MTRHIIHIGYAKTGSNFLRGWFESHPALAYQHGAIAGFWGVSEIAREGAQCADLPLFRVTSSEGLATPHAAVGSELTDYDRMLKMPMATAQGSVCDILAAIFPNADILVVTRGFRAMFLSVYSQYVRTGGDLDFNAFCRLASESGAAVEHWDYGRLLHLYRAAFDGRVHVFPYELLQDDPARFLRAIETRVGFPEHAAPPLRHNPSLSAIEMAWYPRLTRLVRALPIGGRLRRRVEIRYLRLAMKNRLGPLIALCQRLRPIPPVTSDLFPDGVIDAFRGRATVLRDDPLYAPYAEDYLF